MKQRLVHAFRLFLLLQFHCPLFTITKNQT